MWLVAVSKRVDPGGNSQGEDFGWLGEAGQHRAEGPDGVQVSGREHRGWRAGAREGGGRRLQSRKLLRDPATRGGETPSKVATRPSPTRPASVARGGLRGLPSEEWKSESEDDSFGRFDGRARSARGGGAPARGGLRGGGGARDEGWPGRTGAHCLFCRPIGSWLPRPLTAQAQIPKAGDTCPAVRLS